MKKILLFAALFCVGICNADAVLRDKNAVNRTGQNSLSNSVNANRAAIAPRPTARNNSGTSQSRTATNQSVSRRTNAPQTRTQSARTTNPTMNARSTTVNRSGVKNPTRAATSRAATRNTVKTSTNSGRSAVNNTATNKSIRAAASRAAITRAATIGGTNQTFGGEYNTCRDAYFTCMDQFCAYQNESYRRCVCSSRLTDIQNRERALSQSATQLQDFKDLNIDVISKTASEVSAMISETEGESAAASAKDKSDSAQQLAGISAVLSNTKSKALSTSGSLDIAGDIGAIWSTTDFTSSANIANLTGEPLYNAVHAQCAELVAESCPQKSTMDMVVSAYGMYIENDCTTLLNGLDKKLTSANKSIRDTEREMTTARLENYNAHNSTAINDCIAQVRKDLTMETACGKDYVHCLDFTGKYLNYTTGEPIYTAEFYQLQHQMSLSGDVLTNATNQAIVSQLNSMRQFAARGLDTCRDISDSVWTEFMRQAITEIYQGQQTRIRKVKNECLSVVNECYDTQAQQLKDFSNVKEQLLLGSRLETAEEMCQVKLDTCSNLYGDGAGNGLELLLIAMREITDQEIGKQCLVTLTEYAKDICAVPLTDTIHKYPYGCRVYAPGEQTYAQYPICNTSTTYMNPVREFKTISCVDGTCTQMIPQNYLYCSAIRYTDCRPGYYLYYSDGTQEYTGDAALHTGNQCKACPPDYECLGGTSEPRYLATDEELYDSLYTHTNVCGDDYIGSLYQKLVRYATEACVRPSEAEKDNFVLPSDILSDVNSVMDTIRAELGAELAEECKRLGGEWIIQQYDGTSVLLEKFYEETGANKKWGYCKQP